MFKTDNYKNKTVVITGGTKGIGLGITKAYLSLSAKVIILRGISQKTNPSQR